MGFVVPPSPGRGRGNWPQRDGGGFAPEKREERSQEGPIPRKPRLAERLWPWEDSEGEGAALIPQDTFRGVERQWWEQALFRFFACVLCVCTAAKEGGPKRMSGTLALPYSLESH